VRQVAEVLRQIVRAKDRFDSLEISSRPDKSFFKTILLTDLATNVVDRVPESVGTRLGSEQIGYAPFLGVLRGAVFSQFLQDLFVLFFCGLDPLLIDVTCSDLVLRQKVDDTIDHAQILGVMDNPIGGGVLGVSVNPEADVRFQAWEDGKGV